MSGWLEGFLRGFRNLGIQSLATGRPPSAEGMQHLDLDMVTLLLASGRDAISPQGAQQLLASVHALGCLVSLEIIAAGPDIFYQIVVPRRAARIVQGRSTASAGSCSVRPPCSRPGHQRITGVRQEPSNGSPL